MYKYMYKSVKWILYVVQISTDFRIELEFRGDWKTRVPSQSKASAFGARMSPNPDMRLGLGIEAAGHIVGRQALSPLCHAMCVTGFKILL